MAQSIDKDMYFILNKVNPEEEAFMREKVAKNGTIAAVVPTDSTIHMQGLMGEEINVDQPEIAKAVATLLKIS